MRTTGTDATEALGTAIERMIDGRLNAAQIMERIDEYALNCWATLPGNDKTRAAKRRDIERMIRANHRDARP